MSEALHEIIREELERPVSMTIAALAEALRGRHQQAAVAVLFYGSCLRASEAELAEKLPDFYVLVDDYRRAYAKTWLAFANRILPPNVFCVEVDILDRRLRAKYAVISVAQFTHGCSAAARDTSIWARFSQPTRLVWSRDAATSHRVIAACSDAVRTMLRNTWPLVPQNLDAASLLTRGFGETYAAELRPEGSDRGRHIFEADRARYECVTSIVLAELAAPATSPQAAIRAWRSRRRLGKALNLARLVKAAFTFEGGLDYVLWKIRRHSGVSVPVSAWQRRHPLLAAPTLAWSLYRRGAFR
ncbi:MAG TPA: hypothetical protein VMT54_02215 [Candidatus Cybelea sp.]|nr:hypothetical protein [Candidatus Cybelea sp.]